MLYSIITNALVVKDNKLLIAQRSLSEGHDPGKWTIPGGKVEERKANTWSVLENSVKREVEEEVGIVVADRPQLVANNVFIRTGGQHVMATIFLCSWQEGSATPQEDTNDVKWVSEDELGGYDFSPNVQEYLKLGFDIIN